MRDHPPAVFVVLPVTASDPDRPARTALDIARDHRISLKHAREIKAAGDQVLARRAERRRDTTKTED